MVVQIVDIHGVPVLEAKSHPPVARDRYRVPSPQAASERVQPETGDIHAIRTSASIERGEDTQEFGDVPLGNPRGSATLVEFLQTAMPERPDHWLNCMVSSDSGQ